MRSVIDSQLGDHQCAAQCGHQNCQRVQDNALAIVGNTHTGPIGRVPGRNSDASRHYQVDGCPAEGVRSHPYTLLRHGSREGYPYIMLLSYVIEMSLVLSMMFDWYLCSRCVIHRCVYASVVRGNTGKVNNSASWKVQASGWLYLLLYCIGGQAR